MTFYILVTGQNFTSINPKSLCLKPRVIQEVQQLSTINALGNLVKELRTVNGRLPDT